MASMVKSETNLTKVVGQEYGIQSRPHSVGTRGGRALRHTGIGTQCPEYFICVFLFPQEGGWGKKYLTFHSNFSFSKGGEL